MSCNKIAVYSPEDVKIFVGGVYEVSGYVEGTFVGIERVDPVFTSKITSDGTVVRTHKGNLAHKITLTLANTSESNQVFTYLMLADFATQMGKFPLMIKDSQGGSIFFSPSTWIESQPKSNYSLGVEGREWVLLSPFGTNNIGGNYKADSTAKNVLNSLVGGAAGLGAIGGLGGILR